MKLNLRQFRMGDLCFKNKDRSHPFNTSYRCRTFYSILMILLLGFSSPLTAGSFEGANTEIELSDGLTNPPTPIIISDTDVECIESGGNSDIPNDTNELPIPEECIQVCAGSTTSFETQLVGGNSYSWTVLGAASSSASANTVTVTWPSTPGMATVKVTETDGSGLTGTHEICVLILEKPQALFTAAPSTTVCINQNVYFNDMSTGAIKWHWDFGNGQTLAYDANNPFPLPQVNYSSPGNYTVTLTVENECHCEDQYVMNIEVLPSPAPEIECIGVECEGDTATYQCVTLCSSYAWNVTNGTIISTNNDIVTVVWGSSPGYGILEVTTTGCGNGCPNSLIYVPLISSSGNISGDITVCENTQEHYWVSNMPGSTYNWNVTGGGYIVDGMGTNDVVVQWGTSGGTVSVNYYNSVLNCGGSATLNVTVAPEFEITGDEEVCAGSIGTYTANSGSSFDWEVVDDAGATVYGPTAGGAAFNYTFNTVGSFQVIAHDNNATPFCNETSAVSVEVLPVPPSPGSISGEIWVCPNSAYEYTSTVTSNDYFLDWTASNGSPPSQQGEEVSVLWNNTFPTTLSVVQKHKDMPGCASAAVTITVDDKNNQVPSFTHSGHNYNNCQASFMSGQIADDYIWDISPSTAGSVISGQGTSNIDVQWNNNNGVSTSVTVTLTLKNCGAAGSSHDTVFTLNNTPNPVIPVFDFCEGENATYTVTNAGSFSGGNFVWSFGTNGSLGTQNSTSGTTTFTINTQGSYPVEVYYDYGSGGACFSPVTSGVITINPSPTATVTSPDGHCLNLSNPINLFCSAQGGSSNGVYSYQWYNGTTSVGTGANYVATASGSYTCVVTSGNGCTTTSNAYNIDASCTGGGSGSGCSASTANSVTVDVNDCGELTMTGATSVGTGHYWEVEDPVNGNTTYATSTFTHTFSTSGYFNVTYHWSNAGNCYYNETNVYIPLVPDFYPEFSCSGGSNLITTFIDNSDWTNLSGTSTLSWTPSSGSLVTSPNVYDLPSGTQSVAFTITRGGQTCNLTKSVTVPVQATAGFSFSAPRCEDVPVVYSSGTSTGDIDAYEWDFGDLSNSLLENPSRTYLSGGTYTVTLTVTDEYGCTSSASQPVSVNSNNISATYNPNPLEGCKGTAVNLTVNNSTSPGLTNYEWSTGATSSSISVDESGDYIVTVTNANGCVTIMDRINGQFIPLPDPDIRGTFDLCAGDELSLNGFQGADFGYTWASSPSFTMNPNASSANITSPSMSAGTYSVTLTIYESASGLNCTKSAAASVTVNSLPAPPAISVSGTSPLCMDGTPRTMTATSSVNAAFNWSNGDSDNNTTVSNSDEVLAGLYGVTITDDNGCEASNSVYLLPLADFSEFMSGCYEFCDTATINWPGIPGFFSSWTWYQDGSPVLTGSGFVTPLSITASGEYELEVTTQSGCTSTSDIADIYIYPCGSPCEYEFTYNEAVCIGQDANGDMMYYIEFSVYGFSAPANFSVTSLSGGTISGLNPTSIAFSSQTVGFTFTNSGGSNPACFYIFFQDVNGTWECDEKFCLWLQDDCDDSDCEIEDISDIFDIQCHGFDPNTGYGSYSLTFDVNVYGGSYQIASITPAQGTAFNISYAPGVVSTGNNYVGLSFESDMPPGDELCFYVLFQDLTTGRYCKKKFCIEIPDCDDSLQCDFLNFDAVYLDCVGQDAAGNPIYHLYVEVDNGASGFNILGITSTGGSVWSLSTNYLANGNNLVIANFIAYQPYQDPLCYTIILEDSDGNIFYCNFCADDRPPCGNWNYKKGTETTDVVEEESGLIQFGMEMMPNPATDMTNIHYTFVEGKSASILVRDVQGRLIKEFHQLNEKGSLQINMDNWASGMYFIQAVQENVILDKKILIKQ